MAHNHPLLVWDLDTSGIYVYLPVILLACSYNWLDLIMMQLYLCSCLRHVFLYLLATDILK